MRRQWHGMRRGLILGLVALGAALGPQAARAQEGGAQVAEGRIEVRGEGRVVARPDMAEVQAGVSAIGETAGAAIGEMRAGLDPLIAALREAGIDAADLQTSRLSLRPLYGQPDGPRSGPPKIEGYEAVSQLTLRVRDLERLGELLEIALSAGANAIDGLNLTISDASALRDEARRLAVEDAINAAQVLADAAGRSLGPLISLSEDSGGNGPQPMFMESARMSDMPVAEGEIEITARVSASFAIPAP